MNDQYISYSDFQKQNELNNFNQQNQNCNQSQSEMLNNLKALKFSINDLGLYLDTHPNDRNALNIFNNYCNKYKNLSKQYQMMYGPLTMMFPCNSWKWIDEPWPWEGGNS